LCQKKTSGSKDFGLNSIFCSKKFKLNIIVLKNFWLEKCLGQIFNKKILNPKKFCDKKSLDPKNIVSPKLGSQKLKKKEFLIQKDIGFKIFLLHVNPNFCYVRLSCG